MTCHVSEWLSSVNQQTSVRRMWRKGNPHALLVGMQINVATVENSTEGRRTLRIELPYDPAAPLVGIYPKEPKPLIWKDNASPCVRCSIVCNRQGMETASVHQQVSGERSDACIQWIITHKKNEILPFMTAWMDLEVIMLSEINLTGRQTNTI